MKRTFVAIVVMFTCAIATAQERGPSTPEERALAVKHARLLETDPLGPQARDARQWLTVWLVTVPDIAVALCDSFVGTPPRSAKKYEAELVMQQAYSSAAFIIEHPDRASDQLAVFQAGLEGTVKAYQTIRKSNQKYCWPLLDELSAKQEQGQLGAYVEAKLGECK